MMFFFYFCRLLLETHNISIYSDFSFYVVMFIDLENFKLLQKHSQAHFPFIYIYKSIFLTFVFIYSDVRFLLTKTVSVL